MGKNSVLLWSMLRLLCRKICVFHERMIRIHTAYKYNMGSGAGWKKLLGDEIKTIVERLLNEVN